MNLFKKLSLIIAVFTGAAIIISCEGPEGPAGPQGAKGEPGDMAELTCTECHHDDTDLLARQIQYQASGHFTLGNFERSTAGCSACHTHEGFIARVGSGTLDAAEVNQPTPPNCRTCHEIHETYTDADYALTTTDNFTLVANPTATAELGNSNLCAQCHQSRPATLPATGANFQVTSSRWGPHHSNQTQMLMSVGGIELGGVTLPSSNYHKSPGCIGCHMAKPFGRQAGGHNMSIAYDYHGHTEILAAGCVECHPDDDMTDKVHESHEAIEAKLAELRDLLITKGIYDTTNSLAKTGSYPYEVAAAYWNYVFVHEDGSEGTHNPKYAKALIDGAINALK